MIHSVSVNSQNFKSDNVNYNRRFTPPMPQGEDLYIAREMRESKEAKRKERTNTLFSRAGIAAQVVLAAAFSGLLIMEIRKHKLKKQDLQLQKEVFKRQFPDNVNTSKIEDSLIDMTKADYVPDLSAQSINPKVKKFIQEAIDTLKVDKEIREYTGAKMPPRMLLMWGGTGTGKTFTAKIFAKAQGAQYAEVQFSDLSSKYVGETAIRITEKFEQFKKLALANPNKQYVLTFNEVDSLITNVDNVGENTAHYLQNRTSFLNGLDSIKDIPNLTIVGTTNINPHTAKLDAATLNRFGNIIEIPLPTKEELKAALKWQLRDSKAVKEHDFLNKDKGLDKFLDDLVDKKCSQRDLENIVNIALNKFNIAADKKGKPDALKMKFSTKYLKDALNSKEFMANNVKNGKDPVKIELPKVSLWQAIKLRISGWAKHGNDKAA